MTNGCYIALTIPTKTILKTTTGRYVISWTHTTQHTKITDSR